MDITHYESRDINTDVISPKVNPIQLGYEYSAANNGNPVLSSKTTDFDNSHHHKTKKNRHQRTMDTSKLRLISVGSHAASDATVTDTRSELIDIVTKKGSWMPDRLNQSRFSPRRLILDAPFSTRSTISYGLTVYARDTGRWAIIQRKHSVEFLLIIRGLYRLTYLPLLLLSITKSESSILEKCIKGGPPVFTQIYYNDLGLCQDGLEYAMIRMAESRNVIMNLLSKLDLSKNNLKWTWPKGRLHISSDRETPFDCAKREFMEEVEIILPSPLFISDTYISENIKTITGRNIESRYWIYIIPTEIPMKNPESHPEVADRKWVDTETCKSMITTSYSLRNTYNHHDDLFEQIIATISSIKD